MKRYIEDCLSYYPTTFKHPKKVVEHLFAANGNGINLDHKGYIKENHKCDEAYKFPEPEALDWIYPWSNNTEFQPFRELAGCADVGFKDTARYFLECIKATPEHIKHIREWKENLHIVEEVLLNTSVIKPKYTSIDDIDLFLKEIEDSEMTLEAPQDGTVLPSKNSVYKIWFFDVQWSDCPIYVEDEIRKIWCDYELGNDTSMWKRTLNNELFDEYPRTYFWLKHKGVKEGEEFIVNWWW